MPPEGASNNSMSKEHNPIFSKPQGADGVVILGQMNERHRELTEWGLSMVSMPIRPVNVLDIGCGGGMLISILAERFPKSRIFGIDHSPEAVEYASFLNKKMIDEGRGFISEASVSDLPFKDGIMDLVTAVETYYYWSDLENDIKEACRVLSPGGKFMILAESYPHPDFAIENSVYSEKYGMNIVENDVIKKMMESNNLTVKVETIVEKNWVVFVGTKGQ